MNTLLITLQSRNAVIGIKYLHYSLLNAGYNSHILYLPYVNLRNKKTLKSIKEFVSEISPGFIGISLMSIDYYKARDLTKYLKDNFKSIPVIWGGIHPTVMQEQCIEHADYVCIGEGERTIVDFANAVSINNPEKAGIKDIKGLCYLEDGKIKKNPLYPVNIDLDTIPCYEYIPVHSFICHKKKITVLNKKLYTKYSYNTGNSYSVMSSRGCPFACTFCCNNFYSKLYKTKKVRHRSVQNIIFELKKAITDHPDIKYFNFEDDSFLSCSIEYLKEFCEEYKTKIKIPFIVHAIPLYITKDKLKMLKDAGLVWINLGLESGSNRTLKDIYKRQTLKEDFLKAANIVKELDLSGFYDVIVDNPFEKDDDRIETVKVLMQVPRPFMPRIFSLIFYPGTELFENAKKQCPEKIGSYLSNRFHTLKLENINNITRFAPFLNQKYMNKLIYLYKKNPNGNKLKIILLIVKLWVVLILQPIYYLPLTRKSYNGSYIKTIKVLPKLFVQYFFKHTYFLFKITVHNVWPF